MPKYDILVAGEINPDLVLSGDVTPEFGQAEKLVDSASLTIGSSSAIFACGAARLGLRVALTGVCGDDAFGHFMLDAMRARDVDVSHIFVRNDGETGVSVILARRTDRAILTHAGLIPSLRAEDIPDELLEQARHLHVASYFLQTDLQPGLPRLFRRARTLGLTISLDPNYDPSGRWAGFEELLPLTNVFLPNEREALSLSGAGVPEAAAAVLGRSAPVVAVKLGSQGALGLRGERIVHAAAIPVEVVDTVGAGDSFDAGFLYGYLHGWDLERSLVLGCACGGLSTLRPGGTDAQPQLEEAMRYVLD
jgi:sugar/nucleoside kinase (ribokinase family)